MKRPLQVLSKSNISISTGVIFALCKSVLLYNKTWIVVKYTAINFFVGAYIR
jgi:hypothetical protein